jgi:sulfite reductase alpha subunit-like flavoprotein
LNALHSYEPGDVFVVKPTNSPTLVAAFLDHMGWSDIADDAFEVVAKDSE